MNSESDLLNLGKISQSESLQQNKELFSSFKEKDINNSNSLSKQIQIAQDAGSPPREILKIIAEGSRPASPEPPQSMQEPKMEGETPIGESVASDLVPDREWEEILDEQPQGEAPNDSTQPKEQEEDTEVAKGKAPDASRKMESEAPPEEEFSDSDHSEDPSAIDQSSEEELETAPDNPEGQRLKEEGSEGGEERPENSKPTDLEQHQEGEGGEGGHDEQLSSENKMTEEEALQGIIENLEKMTIEEIREAASQANLSPESQQKLFNALKERIASPDLDEEEAEKQSSIEEEAKRIIQESPLSEEEKKKKEEEVMVELEQQKTFKQSKRRRALQKAWVALKIGFEIGNHMKEMIDQQAREEEIQANQNKWKREPEKNELVDFFTIRNNKRR